MPQPLADLLVVDLSRVLAGPFATMMLADLGARVIKVERPGGGDDSRAYGPFMDAGRGIESMYFARVNRGKESIVLDLRSAADVAVLRRIVDRADVLVENFRPGVMDRLGLGYSALSESNPGLVYASISGFGQTGPWRLRPAYDAVVQGASGLMAITGSDGGEPIKSGAPISDLSAGLYAFGAIMAAVHGRVVAGRGTHLDVAMFDTSVSLLEGAALRFLATGDEPPRMGNAHYSIAPFDTFHCADRPIVICAGSDKLFATLCEVLKRPDLATAEPFRTNGLRHENLSSLKENLEEALSVEPAEVWLDRLELAGVPCGPISEVGAAVGSEQAQVRNMVVTAGGLPMAGNPMKGEGWLDGETMPASPALDEHGLTIRQEFGSAPA
jgi:CoA:oxalate CoA-transferase